MLLINWLILNTNGFDTTLIDIFMIISTYIAQWLLSTKTMLDFKKEPIQIHMNMCW